MYKVPMMAALDRGQPLKTWGLTAESAAASVFVTFAFKWQHSFGRVVVGFASRSAAAKFLRRFRAARRWLCSRAGWAACPRSCVPCSKVPLFGLRWLALRPLAVVIEHNGAPPFLAHVNHARHRYA